MRVQSWREGPHYVLYDADAMPQPRAALFDPDHWQAQGWLVGNAPGRGAVAFVRSGSETWALRRYYRGGMVGRWIKQAYLWLGLERTRVWREFKLTAHLHRLGLPVPVPVAAYVSRQGLRYGASLITVRIEDAQPLADYLVAQPLSLAQWSELGATLRRFHEAGVRHDDINARNILRDAKGRFYLIDFDKAQLLPPGRWQKQNLARFKRSLEKFKTNTPGFHFEIKDWTALLSGYSGVKR